MLRTENQIRWFKTVLLLLIFALINACMNSFYATLLDFADLLDTTIGVVAQGLSVRCFGGCIGAFLGGFLFMYMDRFIVCAVFLVLGGFASGLITTVTSMLGYSLCKVVLGLAEGVTRGGVLMTMGDVWGEKASPFIQSIQFVRIVAATVTPLGFSPYLSQRSGETNATTTHFNHTHNHTITAEDIQKVAKSEIWIPYMWLGLLMNMTAIVSVVMVYYSYRYTREFNLAAGSEKQKKTKLIPTSDNPKLEFSYKIIMTVIHCSMIFWVSALNITFCQFWTAFANSTDLHIEKQSAVIMLAGFSLSMTIGSFVTILLAIRLRAMSIILILLIPMFAGNIIIYTYLHSSELMVWIGGILLCIGLGTLQGPVYSALDERIHISNIIGALYVFGANFSLACGMPVFIGNRIEQYPEILVHFVFLSMILVVVHVVVVKAFDCWKVRQVSVKADGNKEKA